jgi:nicotinate (nicotinamide) nucleotide adenylyltransferase
MSTATRGEAILAFFGCFSPPTNGHLGACAVGTDCLEFHGYHVEKVLIIPAHSNYDKPGVLPPNLRLDLCNLMAAAADYVEVDDVELKKDKWSRTIDTLDDIQARYPNRRILLLCGIDIVDSWERSWRKPDIERILREFGLVVLPRLDVPIGNIEDHSAWFAGQSLENVYCAQSNPVTYLSSSLVREKLFTGKHISGLVLPEVERYMKEHKLFQPE